MVLKNVARSIIEFYYFTRREWAHKYLHVEGWFSLVKLICTFPLPVK